MVEGRRDHGNMNDYLTPFEAAFPTGPLSEFAIFRPGDDHLVSPIVAAALLGISDKHVRRLIADGVLPATEGNRPKISLVALGEFRGCPVRAQEWSDADRQVEAQRDRWAAYQRRRREDKSGGPPP